MRDIMCEVLAIRHLFFDPMLLYAFIIVLFLLLAMLILDRYSSCSCYSWGKTQGSVISNQIGKKFGRIVLQVN